MLLTAAMPCAALADESADRAALEAVAQAYVSALNARDADALADLSTPDIVLIDASVVRERSSRSVSGRDAARQAWKQSLTGKTGRITSTTKEITIAGDFAWRIGSVTLELHGPVIASSTESLEIWKRVSGEWKLHRLMSAGAFAGPPMFPRPSPSEPALDKVPR